MSDKDMNTTVILAAKQNGIKYIKSVLHATARVFLAVFVRIDNFCNVDTHTLPFVTAVTAILPAGTVNRHSGACVAGTVAAHCQTAQSGPRPGPPSHLLQRGARKLTRHDSVASRHECHFNAPQLQQRPREGAPRQ